MAEYKIKMELINTQIQALKSDGEPPTTPEGTRIYNELENQLAKVKEEFVNAVLTGQQSLQPADSSFHNYTTVIRLQNAFKNVQTFSGTNAEDTSTWITKLQMIYSTITVEFTLFLSMMMQRLHINVYKSLMTYEETKKITNFAELKTFFTSQYGLKHSIPQRLETAWTEEKSPSTTWPNWANMLESKMSTLEASLLEQRRTELNNSSYELTATDVFQLFSQLKFLTELKTESSDLYRMITAENENLKTVTQMAHRAELLKTQIGSSDTYSAADPSINSPYNSKSSPSHSSRSYSQQNNDRPNTGNYRRNGHSNNRSYKGYQRRHNTRDSDKNPGGANALDTAENINSFHAEDGNDYCPDAYDNYTCDFKESNDENHGGADYALDTLPENSFHDGTNYCSDIIFDDSRDNYEGTYSTHDETTQNDSFGYY